MPVEVTSFDAQAQAKDLAETIRGYLSRPGTLNEAKARVMDEWMNRVYVQPGFPARRYAVADYV